MIQIKQTEDRELLDEIKRQLKENDNYCPCSLTKTDEDKCMCSSVRNIISDNIPGTYECNCGRYIITIQND